MSRNPHRGNCFRNSHNHRRRRVKTTYPTAPAAPTTVFFDASALAVGEDKTPRRPPSPAVVNPPAGAPADADTEDGQSSVLTGPEPKPSP